MNYNYYYRYLPKPDTDQELEDYLKSIYYNPSLQAGFSVPSQLYKLVRRQGRYRVTLKQVKDFLKKQEAYYSYKQIKKHFPRQQIISNTKNFTWQVDVLNMSYYKDHNQGYGYILFCLDTFTRYLITRPMKGLKAEDTKEAFVDIFRTENPPKQIMSDSGSELKGITSQFFKARNIKHFTSKNEVKAPMVERVIKTIRLRLARVLKASDTFQWLSSLQDLTQDYNETVHRSLSMTPLEAFCSADVNALFRKQYLEKIKVGPYKDFDLNVGDYVKLTHDRVSNRFFRAYDNLYTDAVFSITDRRISQGHQLFKIKTYDNEMVLGEFYRSELHPVQVDENTMFEIDKILRRRVVGPRNNRRRELLVSWKGYPKKYISWVDARDVVDLQ